ncbi:hypothetical protein D3C80_1850330 [compost metagenome]
MAVPDPEISRYGVEQLGAIQADVTTSVERRQRFLVGALGANAVLALLQLLDFFEGHSRKYVFEGHDLRGHLIRIP